MLNFEQLFDLVIARKEGIEKSYTIGGKVLKPNAKEQEAIINRTLQCFFHNVGSAQNNKAIQAFTGSSALPVLTTDVFNNTAAIPNWDLAWQESFRGVQLQKGELSWEIATTSTGMIFRLVPEGGKVEYRSVNGEKVTVNVAKYGAGLGITWETIEGRKLYAFVQAMEDARAKLYELWADIHYGLLATAGGSNTVAWQGTGSDTTVYRDIMTLNKGTADLGAANKDKGYGNMANARMILYASPNLKGRINAALAVTSANLNTNGEVVNFPVDPRYTYNGEIDANKAILVLPGNRIQNGVYLRELGLSRVDQDSLMELRTYWTAFGAAVADTDQVYELAFA